MLDQLAERENWFSGTICAHGCSFPACSSGSESWLAGDMPGTVAVSLPTPPDRGSMGFYTGAPDLSAGLHALLTMYMVTYVGQATAIP